MGRRLHEGTTGARKAALKGRIEVDDAEMRIWGVKAVLLGAILRASDAEQLVSSFVL